MHCIERRTQVSKTRVQISQRTTRIKIKNLQNQTVNPLKNMSQRKHGWLIRHVTTAIIKGILLETVQIIRKIKTCKEVD